MRTHKIFHFIVLSLLFYSCSYLPSESIYIRLNQVGFLPDDYKSAIIISKLPFEEKIFTLKNSRSKEIVLVDSIKLLPDKLNNLFNHTALIDFSALNESGEYYIEFQNHKSHDFKIDSLLFNAVRDSLSLFFRVQRCGSTDPLLHNLCHLQDATTVIGFSDSSAVDLTGGWHDAGDYIKFLYTTAFTTYMLIFSYEFSPEKFSFDLNNDSVPDILQEARVGLDFLLRCNFADSAFISQVQDDRDHSVGWRLPEKDTLTFDRPAFVKMNRSQVGIYSAALAIASRIWKEKFFDYDFSDKCLIASKKIFEIRDLIDDYSDDEKYYKQNEYQSKLALASIELFKSANENIYLQNALEYGKQIQENYWWSWGDINALVFYRLAEYNPDYISRLKSILEFYQTNTDSNLFGEAHSYNWGTTHSLMGVVLSSIFYKKLTGNGNFDKIGIINRDYVLGRNPWGMSFIHNIGKYFPKRIHHQIAFFNNGYLPGALVSGPAPDSLIIKYNSYLPADEFMNLKHSAFYIDNFDNFITNEPTISSNATALFVFGCYSN